MLGVHAFNLVLRKGFMELSYPLLPEYIEHCRLLLDTDNPDVHRKVLDAVLTWIYLARNSDIPVEPNPIALLQDAGWQDDLYNLIRTTNSRAIVIGAANVLLELGEQIDPKYKEGITVLEEDGKEQYVGFWRGENTREFSDEEMQLLHRQIEEGTIEPNNLLKQYFTVEQARVIFIDSANAGENIRRMVATVKLLREEVNVTHFGINIPRSEEENFQCFLRGENPESLIEYLEQEESYSPDELRGALVEIQNCGVEIVLCGVSDALDSNAEIAFDTHVDPLYETAKDPGCRMLVYNIIDSNFLFSRDHAIHAGKFYPSIPAGLRSKIGKDVIRVVLRRTQDDFADDASLYRTHNLDEFFSKYAIPYNIALKTGNTLFDGVEDPDGSNLSIVEARHGIIIDRDDDDDDDETDAAPQTPTHGSLVSY